MAAFAIMVGYRMHTKQYYTSEAATARELAQQQQAEAKAALLENDKPKTNETTIYNPLEQFEAPVQHLSKSIFEAQESIYEKTEEIIRQMDRLNIFEQEVETLLQSTKDKGEDRDGDAADTQSSLTHWKELLSVGSLREIPDDELKEFFDNASREIRTVVESDNRNKLAKQFLFDTKLGAKIAKEPRQFSCPLSLTELSIDTDHDDVLPVIDPNRSRRNDAAYESDLEAYLEQFEKKFGNRIQAKGVHALLPKSVKSASDLLEERFKLALDDIHGFAYDLEEMVQQQTTNGATKTSSSSSCSIDKELVASMISAGLNAQTARADVQEALRRAILQHDPAMSVDDLILDADLGGAGTCGGSSGVKSINLRSIIDTPLLIKSIDWIDVVVDTIGGYSDGLDQYLDSLTGLHGTTSVGEILVEGILEQAGNVGDIHVDQYLNQVKDVIQSITGKMRLN